MPLLVLENENLILIAMITIISAVLSKMEAYHA